ncbi:hypothetical protein [sulfur-oxidizing endosymbiont of Gigantopelta aegis]|uniref:hypothetical protein n=1 Tax=sulfur-oxidizing endosymbiont of Gigantopelta aegis TaxID=2794934 RepID=UPI0018DBFD00|nr:hypothetical protein [sulfur-oxidizing endosymbiont of Gigantopelta aegis]
MKSISTNNLPIKALLLRAVFALILLFMHYSVLYASNAVNTGMKSELKLIMMSQQLPVLTSADLMRLPLISIDDMKFVGAFRIKSGRYGESKTGYSNGRIAYNDDNHSLFITGFPSDSSIAEFLIPELVNSSNILELNRTSKPRQDFFRPLLRLKEENTQNLNRLGGMEYVEGELLVHSYEYYDAQVDSTYTSLVIRNANNMNNSIIDGFFEFDGNAHVSLWISPLPTQLQQLFDGDYITGASSVMPINSRASMGPSAFVFNSADIVKTDNTNNIRQKNGLINTIKLLDYNLAHILTDNVKGWLPFKEWGGKIQYNYSGQRPAGDDFPLVYDVNLVGNNYLWTEKSSAQYGIVLPGTRTYAIFGSSSMHYSGGGYKITKKNGKTCPGPCAYDPSDNNNYYWFYDLAELYQIKTGKKRPYEVKPYSFGRFVTPFDKMYSAKRKYGYKPLVSGGTYNAKDKIIYFSLPVADLEQSIYEPAPVIMAYKLNRN